jgi:hypothetical protein
MSGKRTHSCERCRLRAYAERKPHSIIARLWRWHTKWCPGWKAYQKSLAEAEALVEADAQTEADRGSVSD